MQVKVYLANLKLNRIYHFEKQKIIANDYLTQTKILSKWTIELKNSIFGNGMPPTMDEYDKTAFFIADGWGSVCSSMRLRKMSIETGEELSNVLIRDVTRCIYENEQNIYAISNKKIMQLNRNDLSIVRTYKSRVPAYSCCVNSNDADILLLMTANGKYLNIYNLQSEENIKKKVSGKGGCRKIVKVTSNKFHIYTSDSIFEYCTEQNQLVKIVTIEEYSNCIIDSKKRMYVTPNITSPYSSEIVVYPSIKEKKQCKINVGVDFYDFRISNDEKMLYLYKDNYLWFYSIENKCIVGEHVFSNGTKIDSIFNDNMIITEQSIEDREECQYFLTCWKMEI